MLHLDLLSLSWREFLAAARSSVLDPQLLSRGKETAMGAGGNLFGRAISYVVNELVVEGLANNQAFQRFAVKSSRTFQELSVKAEESKRVLMEQVKNSVEASRNQRG